MDNEIYSRYLNGRSFLGGVYRRFFLYPRLCKFLDGVVLDVGCGIGDLLNFNSRAIGVDINPYNILICKNRGLNASIMEIDRLSFSDGTFDSVLLDNVLEHIENPEALVSEIYRVLKPDCRLMVGVPGIKGQKSDQDHKVFYDEKLLKALANTHNFQVEKNFYMPFFLNSSFLSKIFRQYCIYSVWKKR